jgi:NAD(P)-dependent dehydrogenase (short-subunit alcohol dehydrogenase family)
MVFALTPADVDHFSRMLAVEYAGKGIFVQSVTPAFVVWTTLYFLLFILFLLLQKQKQKKRKTHKNKQTNKQTKKKPLLHVTLVSGG